MKFRFLASGRVSCNLKRYRTLHESEKALKMNIRLSPYFLVLCISSSCAAVAQQMISAPEPKTGTIIGTVVDVNDDPVPGASVVLDAPSIAERRNAVTNEHGFFKIDNVRPGIPCNVTISASGFANWISPQVILKPSQYLELTGIRLGIAEAVTTVHAIVSTEQIATQQVKIAEHQRVLGVIPNFYVVYDRQPAPLTSKLKFELALRTATDPVTFAGSAFVAGIDQAADKYDYQQGAKGYAQRFGASYANGLTDIMVGGAILPSILHQDPRYFYQGTGPTRSRILHAISYPVMCRGDNGHLQPNYSSLGGFLASGAISNAYYPESNRGPGLVFSVAAVDVAADMANGLLQEFVLHKLTPAAKEPRSSEVGGN